LLGAEINGGGDVSRGDGGGGSVASIDGGGSAERSNGGGGTALEGDIDGGVGEGRGSVIRNSDDLDGGDGGSATIRDREGTGDGLVAAVSNGAVRGAHGEGSAGIEGSGGTEVSDRGGGTALEVDVGGSSRESGLNVVGDSDDVSTSTLVTAVISSSEGTGEGLGASGSSERGISRGDGESSAAVVSKDGGGEEVGGISRAVARNAGGGGELVEEGSSGISETEDLASGDGVSAVIRDGG
jgi:hypothetical protein